MAHKDENVCYLAIYRKSVYLVLVLTVLISFNKASGL